MSTIYLSEKANKILQTYLETLGHKLVLIQDTGLVYPEVATHADIYMCKLGANPNSSVFQEFSYFKAKNLNQLDLGYRYPDNVKYNAVCMGNYFIHNIKYTSSFLLDKIQQLELKTINVKQGYTKCNMVVVNEHSAITSDKGIYNSVNKYFDISNCHATQSSSFQNQNKINLLLIKPGHVKLGNFPYGFLGGTSGRVGNEIIFNGNLKLHPDYQKIINFITSQGLKPTYFEEYPLEDIGSIIEV